MTAEREPRPGLRNVSLRDQWHLDRRGRHLLQMMVGLTGFGASLALLIRSGLGAAPWDVLHAGLGLHIGLSVGTMSVLISFVVLLAWIPLRLQVGIGTFANALWVGTTMDLTLSVLPEAGSLAPGLVMAIAAVILNGLSGAVYIGAQLGSGARDGLMTGLHFRLGWPIGPTRIALEILVLGIGALLGGPLGIGTVLYALGLGPIIHTALPWVTVPVRPESQARL